MTLSQKAVDFTARHQFSTIAGCWALGITGAFGTIMRNPCVGNLFCWTTRMKLTPDRINPLLDCFQVSKLVPKGMAQLLVIASMTDVNYVSESDRASEDVVPRDNDWSRYSGGCSDTFSDVQTGRRGCWTACEPGSFVARNYRSRTRGGAQGHK